MTTQSPDAFLLLAPGCPHCPGVLDALAKLVKEGTVGRLEVVNVSVHPEIAESLGVRGVPWVRLGPFELEGATPPQTLRQWAERAAQPEAMIDYLDSLLAEGRLAKVEQLAAKSPHYLTELLRRMDKPDLPMQVRLGIGALVEGAAGSDTLANAIPLLATLSAHADHRVRADACHFLGFTGREEARALLEPCLADADPEVREIAQEAWERIGTDR